MIIEFIWNLFNPFASSPLLYFSAVKPWAFFQAIFFESH